MRILILVSVIVVIWFAYATIKVVPRYFASKENVDKATAFTREDPTRPKSILVLGDSTAVGVGALSVQSTAGRVGDALNANVENYAENGAKISDLEVQFERRKKNAYDLVLVQIGANDVIYFSSLERASNEFEALISRLTSVASSVVLLTAGDIGKAPIFPFPISYLYTVRTKQLRGLLKPIAEKNNLIYIDLFTLPNPFLTDIPKYYSSDRLHLSGDGYEVWARYILEAIREKV